MTVPLPRRVVDPLVDGGEDDGARVVVLRLHVCVDLERHPRGVRAHHADRNRLRPLGEDRQQSHLHLRHVQRGDALRVAVIQLLHDPLYQVRVHHRGREHVQEDVAARDGVLQTLHAHLADADLKRVQRLHERLLRRGIGVGDGLGVQRVHRGTHGAHEEASAKRERAAANHDGLFRERLVQVDRSVRNGHQLDPVVSQPSELEVVRQRRLDEPDETVLLVVQALLEGDRGREVPARREARRGRGLRDRDARDARVAHVLLHGTEERLVLLDQLRT